MCRSLDNARGTCISKGLVFMFSAIEVQFVVDTDVILSTFVYSKVMTLKRKSLK